MNSRITIDNIESAQDGFEALIATSARIRGRIIKLSHQARTPHLGSSLSFVELMVYLYWNFLKISPENPEDAARDRFVLSKGHGVTTLYAVLAERGFFTPELFKNYAQVGSPLPEHPSPRCVPGIEAATGSLGHGLSVATGIALASKLHSIPYNVVSLLSDGECNEGSTWEAALLAPAHKLDNLISIIDFNKWQATGRSIEITSLEPLDQKFESFGWNSTRIDGHDFSQIKSAMTMAQKSDKPFAIIADTIKGKGIKLMEDDNNWHYRIPSEDEVDSAFEELGIDPSKCETPLQMKFRKLPNRTRSSLIGDIGNRLFDKYKESNHRFINCGVAEANMISMSSGLAMSGMKPVAYAFASFLIYRAFEQIRVDLSYHDAAVLLVGVGGGLSYASNGSTHHTLEDIALMRSLPNMQVICAGDPLEVRATKAFFSNPKPTYLRIEKRRGSRSQKYTR